MTNQQQSKAEWHKILNERFSGTPREAARYYGIEILPRLMPCLEKNKQSCKVCTQHFMDMDNMTVHALEWMKKNDPQIERFQQLMEEIGKHLKSAHGIMPGGMILSRFVAVGLLAGALAGLIISFTTKAGDIAGSTMLGAVVGIFVAWIAGKIRENSLRKAQKLF